MQVEVAIGAEILSGKELAVRAGHEAHKLFVREFVELLGRNRLANPESSRFHTWPYWLGECMGLMSAHHRAAQFAATVHATS